MLVFLNTLRWLLFCRSFLSKMRSPTRSIWSMFSGSLHLVRKLSLNSIPKCLKRQSHLLSPLCVRPSIPRSFATNQLSLGRYMRSLHATRLVFMLVPTCLQCRMVGSLKSISPASRISKLASQMNGFLCRNRLLVLLCESFWVPHNLVWLILISN